MRLSILLAVALAPALLAEPPKVLAPGGTVELVASDPDLRTPTAIAVDAKGRVWVLENNTHFRPKKYDAPPTDRVLILDDFGPDGRARKITTYADGFSDGMGLLLLPGGDVLVSTRAATLRLGDKDGDGRADERRTLLTLVTDDKYPHNGLSSLARGPDGAIFLGFGENHGVPWTLTGTDGTVLRGTDEGAIFRFDEEGHGLVHWALGLWNPFGLAFDPVGRLFALDNDPGGGSLCRLLHIVRSGDYGYRYRYGRTTDHPFISWEGRWPGTLPPMCLSGEAPTGLLWHGGALLGCTWTDHGIQRFPLEARGASFTTKPEWLVRGGNDFRPSGIAAAPDGSLLISDWVDGAYEVHGKGRVWRVRGVGAKSDAPIPPLGAISDDDALTNLRSDDPFLFRAAVLALAKPMQLTNLFPQIWKDADARFRLGALLVGRQRKDTRFLSNALRDSDPAVRRAALQWIGEERLTDFAAQLDTAIAGNPTRMVFDAYLAAAELLASEKIDTGGKVSTGERFRRIAEIALPVAATPPSQTDPALRALALRLLPVSHQALTMDALRGLLTADARLAVEAARILAARADETAQSELRRLARDEKIPADLRAEALAGLVHSASAPETREILKAAIASDDEKLRREAARALAEPLAATETPAATKPDPAAGRRLFFHPNGPLCANCHQIEGRGRAIGPDLTSAWRMSAEKLTEAIREPSKEIAPAFAQWHVKMRAGGEAAGIDQFVDSKSDFTLLDATGTRAKYRFDDVLTREPLPISLMPPALTDRLSPQEFADLIAYLRQPRE